MTLFAQVTKKDVIFVITMRTYNHLILGGTFDHFHVGHELFISTALKRGKRLTIGITTEVMYRHKLLASQIEPYKLRQSNIFSFIKKMRNDCKNVTCIPLTDIYGTGLVDKTVDGIVVTQDTKKGGEIINKKRKVGVYPVSEKSWKDIGEWTQYYKNVVLK